MPVETAVVVRGLGKRYVIQHQAVGSYVALRDVLADRTQELMRSMTHPLEAFKGRRAGSSREMFWALNGVDFTIHQGERVGIIGRNGAGKSTLLKILSRITDPSVGEVRIRGRVASLLEVGTGFHPELTGRQNIYLNGAILGMSRADIKSRFDEIVDFAEVERFLDTPVKRYSSGMYVRLAFAVAAHLEPEILIVDEVLAVGDASFQKKCLNKMEDVGQQGRTVLFVSHNMAAITRLCDRAILLDQGHVLCDDTSSKVVSTYLQSGVGSTAIREWTETRRAPGNDIVRLRAVRVKSEDGEITDSLDIRRPVNIEVEYEVLTAGHVLVPHLDVLNDQGVTAFVTIDLDPEWFRRPRPVGCYLSTVCIPGNFLAEGGLVVGVVISTLDPFIVHAHAPDAVAFHVVDSAEGTSARGDYGAVMPGVVRPLLPWVDQVLSGASDLAAPT